MYDKPKRRFTWKRALLVFLAITLVLSSAAAFVYARYLHPTGEIMPNIYAIRNDRNGIPFVNFFLVRAGEHYIAFDAGYDPVQTENQLQRLGISADAILAVFITHDDFDHIGALDLFHNATIYTGPIDLPQFPHEILSDGQIIMIEGLSIQIIYTPGHTSGCVVYLVNGRYLFAGDLFVNPHHARYHTSLQIQHQERVLELDGVEYIFNGHFGLFRNIRFIRLWFG